MRREAHHPGVVAFASRAASPVSAMIKIDRHRREFDVEFLHRFAVFVVIGIIAFDQCHETGLFLGTVVACQFLFVAGSRDEVGDNVVGLQAERDDIVGQLDLAVAHMVEHRLELMGEPDQSGKVEGTGAALDRMDGPEHRVEAIRITIALLDSHELLFKLAE